MSNGGPGLTFTRDDIIASTSVRPNLRGTVAIVAYIVGMTDDIDWTTVAIRAGELASEPLGVAGEEAVSGAVFAGAGGASLVFAGAGMGFMWYEAADTEGKMLRALASAYTVTAWAFHDAPPAVPMWYAANKANIVGPVTDANRPYVAAARAESAPDWGQALHDTLDRAHACLFWLNAATLGLTANLIKVRLFPTLQATAMGDKQRFKNLAMNIVQPLLGHDSDVISAWADFKSHPYPDD